MDALDEYGSSDNESAGAPASNAVPAALTSPPGSPSTRNAAQAPSTRNAAQAAEVLLRPLLCGAPPRCGVLSAGAPLAATGAAGSGGKAGLSGAFRCGPGAAPCAVRGAHSAPVGRGCALAPDMAPCR